MADGANITIESNTPEHVAFKLLTVIARAEGHRLYGMTSADGTKPDRKWILDTYTECLRAVGGKRQLP